MNTHDTSEPDHQQHDPHHGGHSHTDPSDSAHSDHQHSPEEDHAAGSHASGAMKHSEASGADQVVEHATHVHEHAFDEEPSSSIPADLVDHGKHKDHADHTGHEEMFRKRFWISLALSIPVLLYSPSVQGWFGFTTPPFPGSQWVSGVLSIVIFAYGGTPFLRLAIPELRLRRPGMMTLISLAISVAFVYSLAVELFLPGMTFWWELVLLIDVMLLGHWMEMRSVRQASGALDELAKLMPDTAERIAPGGDVEEVPVSKLKTGDLVLVRPGANVPADGIVVEGKTDANESMITGESKPVRKDVGDRVIAGSINGDGSLRVEVKATGDETALAGIMRLVLEAQRSKSNTQVLADKAAGWLFYIAVVAAAVTAVIWSVAIGFNIGRADRQAHGGCDQHRHRSQERHPGARSTCTGRGARDRHRDLRQDWHAHQRRVRGRLYRDFGRLERGRGARDGGGG